MLLPAKSLSTELVAGVIAAWGRVVVDHRGLRAECARILALASPPQRYHVRTSGPAAVAARLGVPVVAFDALEQHAAAATGTGLTSRIVAQIAPREPTRLRLASPR